MKILIAGKDRTDALAGQLTPDVSRKGMRAPAFLAPQHSALVLRTAPDQAGYLDILLRLIWMRRGIAICYFDVPRKHWPISYFKAKTRSLLWRLLRYQHDRMIFQHNTLNESLIGAIEYEREQRLRETAELRGRIENLEKRQGGST